MPAAWATASESNGTLAILLRVALVAAVAAVAAIAVVVVAAGAAVVALVVDVGIANDDEAAVSDVVVDTSDFVEPDNVGGGVAAVVVAHHALVVHVLVQRPFRDTHAARSNGAQSCWQQRHH